jgi:hypothetical protein
MHSEDRQLRAQHQLSQFAGRPIYFFDTRYLLATAKAVADWNPQRLEAAIAPRVEHVLAGAGDYVAVEKGFYVVFTGSADAAREKADAICTDILTHFYGPGHAHHAERLRRKATLDELNRDLDLGSREDRKGTRGDPGRSPVPASHIERSVSRRVHAPVTNPAETPEDAEQFLHDLSALFQRHLVAGAEEDAPLFSPIWDSRKGRITAFACRLGAVPRDAGTAEPTPGATQCRADVAVLAAACRGAQHLVARGDVALISVPVHTETLSWTKTRSAYVDVLGHIEPRALALIAPRIVGLHAGLNLADVALWARALRRHAHWVFVHLPNADIDMSRFGLLGVTGFGISVRVSANDEHALDGLGIQAAKLAGICLRQNAVAIAYDVASPRELALLKKHGVRFMSGPAIGAASELPAAVAELSCPDVA